MTVDIGRIGVFGRDFPPEQAAEIEALGYGAIWIGGSPPGDLAVIEELLDATTHIVAATGVVNMWAVPAAELAASYRRIEAKHPDRCLLGVGIGHPEVRTEYRSPLETIAYYLDELDAEGVPVENRILAALGPKVLQVAGQRTVGAHPYLTIPEHTRQAREILGEGPLLAPEHKVVVDTDVEQARAIGRKRLRNPYLGLSNYRRNLVKLGFTEQDLDTASDRLVDALTLHGDADTVAAGVTAHLDAGADHVPVQFLTADGDRLPAIRSLAKALNLS